MSKPTLLEQLALLSNPAPTDLDPENAYSSLNASKSLTRDENKDEEGEDDDLMGESADARGHYLDVGPSSLRKAAEDKEKELEDMAKYGGQRRSRKQIFEDEESEGGELEDEEDDLSDDEDEEQGGGEGGDESGEDDEVPSAEDDASMGDDEDADGTPADDGPAQSLEMTQILSSLRSSISSDVTKGLAVKRQLDLFEAVMPVRIRLQKGILAVDELAGREEELKALLEGDDRQGEDEQAAEERRLVEEIQAELKTLSEGLFELRQGISSINTPEIDLPSPTKRSKLSHSPSSSSSSPSSPSSSYFARASLDALSLSDASHPHVLSTLNKWSSKILAAQGLSSLLPRDKFRAVKVGAVEQIGAGLAKRAREGDLMEGEKEFYGALVRDVIERKGGGGLDSASSAPPLPNRMPKSSRQKASIDTRASKGRKLRFTPQEKIMNFMVPVKMEGVGGGWHEEQVDELFASLLGRKTDLGIGEDDEAVKEVGLGGLRVF